MLHLVRKKGDAILIDGGITIRVLEVEGHHVRLGVEAPRSVGIYRGEIVERIRTENAAAMSSADAVDALPLPEKPS
jgi:carbon storage regulator